MEMNIGDRLEMINFLPKEGDYIHQTIVQDIMKKIGLSQEDMKKADIKVIGTGFHYMPEKDFDVEIEFTNVEIKLLKERYDELNRIRKITPQNYDLCTKIKDITDEEEEVAEDA